MKVTLISATDIKPAELAAACSTGQMNNPNATSLASALKSGHLSVLEHVYFTWKIEGISRACSHQLVRHRLASYTQESQRYCKINTELSWYVVPLSIYEKGKKAEQKYHKQMKQIAEWYNEWTTEIPKEDARFILPNACKTNIIMSMDARAFIEASQKRLCNKAQWEIKELFSEMVRTIVHHGNLACISNICASPCRIYGKCPEAKSCGKVKL